MTDEDLRDKLSEIESRLSRLEKHASMLDARTVGSIRLGPRPIDEREEGERFKQQLKTIAIELASTRVTTDPADPRLKRGLDDVPVPQNDAYLVLPADQIAKGYVQPYRDSYRHLTCDAVTTMGTTIAATYAVDPWFYGATYCTTCAKHRPLAEFRWLDGSPMSPNEWSQETQKAVQDRIAKRDEALRAEPPQ